MTNQQRGTIFVYRVIGAVLISAHVWIGAPAFAKDRIEVFGGVEATIINSPTVNIGNAPTVTVDTIPDVKIDPDSNTIKIDTISNIVRVQPGKAPIPVAIDPSDSIGLSPGSNVGLAPGENFVRFDNSFNWVRVDPSSNSVEVEALPNVSLTPGQSVIVEPGQMPLIVETIPSQTDILYLQELEHGSLEKVTFSDTRFLKTVLISGSRQTAPLCRLVIFRNGSGVPLQTFLDRYYADDIDTTGFDFTANRENIDLGPGIRFSAADYDSLEVIVDSPLTGSNATASDCQYNFTFVFEVEAS